MDRGKGEQMTKGLGAYKGSGEVPRYVDSMSELLLLLSTS